MFSVAGGTPQPYLESTYMNKINNLLLTGIALILMQGCGSSTKKEADIPVRKSCNLERLYKDVPQNIRTDTPDLAFVNALCAGKALMV